MNASTKDIMDPKDIKKHFAHIIESINESLLIINERGEIVYANSSAENMIGLERNDLIGQAWKNLTCTIYDSYGKELHYKESPMYIALSTAQPVCSLHILLEQADGTRKTLLNNSVPLHDLKGNTLGVVSSFTDITEHTEIIELSNALSQINTSIGSTLDFGEIMTRIAEQAASALHCEAASIVIKEEDGWYLRYAYGFSARFLGIRLPNPMINAIARYFSVKEPVTIVNVERDPRYGIRLLGKFGVKSFVSIPLIAKNETIGMASFTNHTRALPFTRSQVDFSQKLAVSVSLAIENASLYSDQRQAADLGNLLNELHTDIGSTLDYDEIMNRVILKASGSLGAESAAIIMAEDSQWAIRHAFNLPSDYIGIRLGDEDLSYAGLSNIKEPLVFANAFSDKRLNPKMIKRLQIRSLLIAPLIIKNEFVGALSFHYHSAPVIFNKHQIDFARKLGVSLSLAVENSDLYANQQKSAQLSSALNDLHLEISSTLDFNEIMSRVVVKAAEALGAESASIDMLEDGLWAIRFIHGMPEEFIGVKMSDSDAAHAAIAYLTRQPVIINDAYSDTRLNLELVKQLQIRSVLTVPLIVRNEVVGALSFHYHSAPVTFDDHQIDFAKKLSSTLALAIENSRVYETTRHTSDILQEALLVLPRHIDGVEFGYLYKAARDEGFVGGDFYDLFEIEHGLVGIITGDVSGKGLEAATFTSLLKNTLKAYSYPGKSTARIMSKTNQLILRSSEQYAFATAFLGILNTETGELNCCNAGHPPAVVQKKDGTSFLLGDHNAAIGLFSDEEYTQQTITLQPDDILFLYTDGATEARHGKDFFGEQRLEKAVNTLKENAIDELPKLVYRKVMDFSGGVQRDDIALLAVSLKRR